ncbi:MAG: alpha-galactosidase, partial [Candidatus Aminicenantales bacterium]
MKIIILWTAILALLIAGPAETANPAGDGTKNPVIPKAGPCRVRDGGNPDLFVMTLGEVVPSIAQGTYDPATDTVTMADGSVTLRYFRDTLGIASFRPIDKSIFPLPPSGFCTWYYYYQDVNENEVIKNARWIAENLKDYGAKYVQVDDGWQKETAEGGHGSRDWTGTDKAFPGGMAALAAAIKSLGLTPGIWIAPHGQSNEAVVRQTPGVFMFKPDGTSASVSWEGKFLVDPSVPATMEYLKKLFTMMTDWGYEYFKIDGQPDVIDEFRKAAAFMKNPGDAVKLYRETIAAVREAIGPNRYLLGCWGTPVEGAGYLNGSRTGGDIVLGWDGFRVALDATMRWYFTHNILWYADPDVVCVRPPLTFDQARVWATLQGLTGQALLTSDRLPDLSEERVRLLKRIYPAADIRPLDLFPSPRNKKIWDLKVNHLGRAYDVVGVFNFDESRKSHVVLNWKDLGLSGNGPVHVFDFWNDEYVGAWEGGISVALAPTSCRVLTLVPASDRIQLVSTNRHLTQGWIDLASLSVNPEGTAFSGRSHLIKNDPYELHFAYPRGKSFAVARASARSGSGTLPVRIFNRQGWATVRIDSPATTAAEW